MSPSAVCRQRTVIASWASRPMPAPWTAPQGIRANPSPWPRSPPRWCRRRDGSGVAIGQRSRQHVGLDLLQRDPSRAGRLRQQHRLLLAVVPAGDDHLALGQIAGPDLDADRHALELPVGGPPTEADADLVVQPGPDARRHQIRLELAGGRCRPSPSSSRTTRTTAWISATRGGIRRPRSSPWAMISPPIIRVDAPHEVVQHSCWLPVGVGGSRCRTPGRSSGPARGWCPSAAPCRRASSPRR